MKSTSVRSNSKINKIDAKVKVRKTKSTDKKDLWVKWSKVLSKKEKLEKKRISILKKISKWWTGYMVTGNYSAFWIKDGVVWEIWKCENLSETSFKWLVDSWLLVKISDTTSNFDFWSWINNVLCIFKWDKEKIDVILKGQ